MRTSLFFVFSLFLWCGGASAAMFGDFMVPEDLRPELQAATGHGGRFAVVVTPPGGKSFALYLPVSARDVRPWSALPNIGQSLACAGENAIFNLGGRGWFGGREARGERTLFYDGYMHRNGFVYNVAFSMDDLPAPDVDMKRALARIWLLPGLASSPAVEPIAAALDRFELGEWDDIPGLLDTAVRDDPDCWVIPYLRGRLEEARGEFAAALEQYNKAVGLKPDDMDAAARAAAMECMAGDADKGAEALFELAAMDSDEATIWEALGRVYLASGDTDAARDYFEEAAEVNPASETALYNLAFMLAEAKEYENALRRAREFVHYFPWVPSGVVPDVTGAPGMTEETVEAALNEPLPLGRVGTYGACELAGAPLCVEEILVCRQIIPVAITETVVYDAPDVYVPLIVYDWEWSPRRHRPWKPGPGMHKPRPPWSKPGGPGGRPPKPPPHRPPHRPGQPGVRPGGSRPPHPGGPRPGVGRPGRPGPGRGEAMPPPGPSENGEAPRPPRKPIGEGGRPARPPARPVAVGSGGRVPGGSGSTSGAVDGTTVIAPSVPSPEGRPHLSRPVWNGNDGGGRHGRPPPPRSPSQVRSGRRWSGDSGGTGWSGDSGRSHSAPTYTPPPPSAPPAPQPTWTPPSRGSSGRRGGSSGWEGGGHRQRRGNDGGGRGHGGGRSWSPPATPSFTPPSPPSPPPAPSLTPPPPPPVVTPPPPPTPPPSFDGGGRGGRGGGHGGGGHRGGGRRGK